MELEANICRGCGLGGLCATCAYKKLCAVSSATVDSAHSCGKAPADHPRGRARALAASRPRPKQTGHIQTPTTSYLTHSPFFPNTTKSTLRTNWCRADYLRFTKYQVAVGNSGTPTQLVRRALSEGSRSYLINI